jgi:hypothetical protein
MLSYTSVNVSASRFDDLRGGDFDLRGFVMRGFDSFDLRVRVFRLFTLPRPVLRDFLTTYLLNFFTLVDFFLDGILPNCTR